jgi:hypothetical protein
MEYSHALTLFVFLFRDLLRVRKRLFSTPRRMSSFVIFSGFGLGLER